MNLELNHSSLHHRIITQIVAHSCAPKVAELSDYFAVSVDEVVSALQALQAYHGVVLHPVSNEIWVMHPFSTAPTNFWIRTDEQSWWSNCAWCALGAAALINRDVSIITSLAAEDKKIAINIRNGVLEADKLFVHFPIPMTQAWDNVTYTCSTMLMFDSVIDVERWCRQYGMKQGDVQPIEKVWEFAKVWYGKHLDADWKKWSVDEARLIFQKHGLVSDIWQLPDSDSRF